jgi:hypothetical protein
VRYTDPSGHDVDCPGYDAGTCGGNPSIAGKLRMLNVQSYEDVKRDNSIRKMLRESENVIKNIPGSSEFWNNVATGLDFSVLIVDGYAVGIVIYGGIAGAGIALPFAEAVPIPIATGLAGMGIAELSVQGLLTGGNVLSVLSSGSTIISDIKAGNTIISQGIVAPSTSNSIEFTITGIFLREAFTSFLWQGGAVLNDFRVISFPNNETYKFPFP